MPSPLMAGRCVTAEMRLSMARSTGCSPSPKNVPVLVRTCQVHAGGAGTGVSRGPRP